MIAARMQLDLLEIYDLLASSLANLPHSQYTQGNA